MVIVSSLSHKSYSPRNIALNLSECQDRQELNKQKLHKQVINVLASTTRLLDYKRASIENITHEISFK